MEMSYPRGVGIIENVILEGTEPRWGLFEKTFLRTEITRTVRLPFLNFYRLPNLSFLSAFNNQLIEYLFNTHNMKLLY